MARRKISTTQAYFMVLLWGFLVYLLIAHSQEFNAYSIFVIIASGIIVFVPIYKSIKKR